MSPNTLLVLGTLVIMRISITTTALFGSYSDADEHEIILENYANTGFPIDMMVIDMDFHKRYAIPFPLYL